MRVSPGFTPRPSLSVYARPAHRVQRRRVAGVHAPAFVERPSPRARIARASRVAGVHAPAFVERSGRGTRPRRAARVAGVHAPAFVERSDSVGDSEGATDGVAGVHAPAFVERRRSGSPGMSPARVSPGFTPRPSLSEEQAAAGPWAPPVSPGFTPRPSLSGSDHPRGGGRRPGVAGVHAPAFVERGAISRLTAVVRDGCRRGSRPGLR